MRVFRLFVVALLVCVLSAPVIGCGGKPKPPAKADPADSTEDLSKMKDVLPAPGAGGMIGGGPQKKAP